MRAGYEVRPFSWVRIAPLEMAWSGAIVVVCMVLCVQRVPALLSKVQLMETVFQLPSQNGTQLEALALTGRLDTLAPMEPQLRGRLSYGWQEGQAVAMGTQRDGLIELSLGMRLAVTEQSLGWHSLPLCGLRETPPGWNTHAKPLARGVPSQQLPFVCRPRWGLTSR